MVGAMETQDVERRCHERFNSKDRAFAILQPGVTTVGRIIDISKGGLSFWYPDGKQPSAVATAVDIYFDTSRYFGNLPCKIVYDIAIPGKSPVDLVQKRRRGVQFVELTAGQLSKLEYFLRNNTDFTKDVPVPENMAFHIPP